MKLINKITKWALMLILIGAAFGFKSQSFTFSFEDEYGNAISIENTELIPEIIDAEFLKNNLNGKDFNYKPKEESVLKFNYVIVEFVQLNKMVFRLRVLQSPISNLVEDHLMHFGYSHYRVQLKKTKNRVHLTKVEFMYSEI